MNLWNLLLDETVPAGGGGDESFGVQMANILVWYVFPALLAISVIWVIYIGVLLAKAKDEGARRQAKDRFVKAFAALFIIGCLYVIMITVKFVISPPGGEEKKEANFIFDIFYMLM